MISPNFIHSRAGAWTNIVNSQTRPKGQLLVTQIHPKMLRGRPASLQPQLFYRVTLTDLHICGLRKKLLKERILHTIVSFVKLCLCFPAWTKPALFPCLEKSVTKCMHKSTFAFYLHCLNWKACAYGLSSALFHIGSFFENPHFQNLPYSWLVSSDSAETFSAWFPGNLHHCTLKNHHFLCTWRKNRHHIKRLVYGLEHLTLPTCPFTESLHDYLYQKKNTEEPTFQDCSL